VPALVRLGAGGAGREARRVGGSECAGAFRWGTEEEG
jgi:hypothetical protein